MEYKKSPNSQIKQADLLFIKCDKCGGDAYWSRVENHYVCLKCLRKVRGTGER